jgi:hypothetical protein
LESDEKRILIRRVAEVMGQRLDSLDATDCSRLAWLFMHLRDDARAHDIASKMDSRGTRRMNIAPACFCGSADFRLGSPGGERALHNLMIVTMPPHEADRDGRRISW